MYTCYKGFPQSKEISLLPPLHMEGEVNLIEYIIHSFQKLFVPLFFPIPFPYEDSHIQINYGNPDATIKAKSQS